MTPKTRIRRIIDQELALQNTTLEILHSQGNHRLADLFWSTVLDTWLDWCRENIEQEPQYRWDKEFDQFWDITEKLFPEYVLKSHVVE